MIGMRASLIRAIVVFMATVLVLIPVLAVTGLTDTGYQVAVFVLAAAGFVYVLGRAPIDNSSARHH